MDITRRFFLKTSAGIALSGGFFSGVAAEENGATTSGKTGVALQWMNEGNVSNIPGTTFGIPWSLGETEKSDTFQLIDEYGNRVAAQTWPLAYWPDGSVKWSAIAVGSGVNRLQQGIRLQRTEKDIVSSLHVVDEVDHFWVDNGTLRLKFNRTGSVLIDELWIEGRLIGRDARTKIIVQDVPDTDEGETVQKKELESRIHRATIENEGTERVLVKVEGAHYNGKEALFSFVLRFYIYKNTNNIKIIHTFLFDADENSCFIKGIGIAFDVLFAEEETYNRHIRFVGEDGGVFSEAVKGLTGLRRDPGPAIRKKQIAGEAIGPPSTLSLSVQKGLTYIPEFGDYTLTQFDANGYTIRKRTKTGFSWLEAASGSRAAGTAYIGSPKGGLAISLRDFWQSHPAQLDIKNGSAANGQLIAWLWSPLAPAMDLRFYHDGMGQDSYEKQWEGLEITYEDYEPGFSSPRGVARTSELYLTLFEHTPDNPTLVTLSDLSQKPPVLCVSPEYLYEKKVFGNNWSLPNRQVTILRAVEERLDRLFDFYKNEVDARSWYGFWNYGDFMHSYDEDRQVWKYDIGGFAWDNSELSTDLWLWYYYLRSGRADAFRLAEAMCRHTGEVDVYHLGKFAPLGSRHNVMHWGCSAKQLRISTAINRRFFYYLTGDERTGDLLQEQVEAVRRLESVVPLRKRLSEPLVEQPGKVYMSFGTDWGAVAAAWFTQWERTLDKGILRRLTASMRTIAAQPQGFFTGVSYFHVDSGQFDIAPDNAIHVSHLNAAFGLVEICAEILDTIKHKAFEAAWLQYCKLYNAGKEERLRVLGTVEGKFNLRSSHARLTAYAAFKLKDKRLAKKAWMEFSGDEQTDQFRVIEPPETLHWVKEWKHLSTNWAAQWSLTAIQCVRYIGNEV